MILLPGRESIVAIVMSMCLDIHIDDTGKQPGKPVSIKRIKAADDSSDEEFVMQDYVEQDDEHKVGTKPIAFWWKSAVKPQVI